MFNVITCDGGRVGHLICLQSHQWE